MMDKTKKIIAIFIIIFGLIMMPIPIIPGIIFVAIGIALWEEAREKQDKKKK